MHWDKPIEAAGSKLTLFVIALLMLAEACAKVISSYLGTDNHE